MSDSASKLEPYLLLARSTKGASAAKVITDVTAAAGVYVFAELLDLPNIKDLSADPTYQGHYNLLRLFAYGNLTKYDSSPSSYPPLTPAHTLKLKHLTLVSLALHNRSLTYDQILTSLRIESIRQLEDLIIDAIYAGLLSGKMHHHEKVLHVDWVASRDLEEQDLIAVQNGLLNWCKTAETLLTTLDEQILVTRQNAANEAADQADYKAYRDREYETIALELKNSKMKPAYGGFGPRGGNLKDFQMGGLGGSHLTNEGLLASTAGGKPGVGAGVAGGRLLTREVSSPDELEGKRSSKRFRD
ncbi:uncharacterized protein I206_105880 [Kwoniella pini CBS 10737]|uniref:PCI domain-containing protein n=1 Tax=Kwoniella pini CBS 10737 TaxID=1296096 RepID=A0A1B9I0E6_9TREE|nr:uncharacterized protein I206_04700 [Kwoniella pini CBS 10737]OCF49013.1 hypothetical protein I206_04700 [Kwoniella pini CBS 10737]